MSYSKIKYRDKDSAIDENGACYTDIEPFVDSIIKAVDSLHIIDLSILPGDGNAYTYRVQWENKKHKHLNVQDLRYDWEVIIPRYMSPCYLKKAVEPFEIGAWSAALVCDLMNRICRANHQTFYNWGESAPQYILDDTVPFGWDEDCTPQYKTMIERGSITDKELEWLKFHAMLERKCFYCGVICNLDSHSVGETLVCTKCYIKVFMNKDTTGLDALKGWW